MSVGNTRGTTDDYGMEKSMNNIQILTGIGQSIWLDYISRSLITSGELQSLLDAGVRGMTSNPTIFEKAITGSLDYDDSIKRLVQRGKSIEEIYSALTLEDIQKAADLMRPIYNQSEGGDGYVSLEVNPNLAHDTQSTLEEAQSLWKLVDRPNLMIKIPGTREGIPATTQAIAAGINVNVTLIFSIDRYIEVLEAFMIGIEKRLSNGLPIEHIASVASFFISRIDSKVDNRLAELIKNDNTDAGRAEELQGRAAVANARLSYSHFLQTLESERYKGLLSKGAHIQRPLWASTSTKNPSYPDIKYVQELIAPNTVNTLPLATLLAFLDHGDPGITIEQQLEHEIWVLESLAELGIDMPAITNELEEEGVAAFVKSFESLLRSIEIKHHVLLS
jgi:transaldolase